MHSDLYALHMIISSKFAFHFDVAKNLELNAFAPRSRGSNLTIRDPRCVYNGFGAGVGKSPHR